MDNSSKLESSQRDDVERDSIAHRELLSQLSHELRTPMAVIMGFADIIFEETDDPSIKEHTSVIRRTCASLLKRLNEILDDSATAIDNAKSTATTDQAQTGVSPQIGAKILLADDLRDVRFIASRILTRAACRVTAVENGRQAVIAIQSAIENQDPFDLAILDIHMPEMTGMEAVAELRAGGVEIPVIALTADATEWTHEKLLHAGFADCLSKPILRQSLLSTICELLDVT